MTVNNTRLVIQQGTSWAISWPITDESGEPMDLSGDMYDVESTDPSGRGGLDR